MNLLIEQIEQLRLIGRQLRSKQITIDEVHAHIAISGQLHRFIQSAIQIYAAANGTKLRATLRKLNIIDEDTAIAVASSPETEYVKCPEREDKLVLRSECLDWSGSHMSDCNGCESFVSTREALLPP
jgi:hypothetical protein